MYQLLHTAYLRYESDDKNVIAVSDSIDKLKAIALEDEYIYDQQWNDLELVVERTTFGDIYGDDDTEVHSEVVYYILPIRVV